MTTTHDAGGQTPALDRATDGDGASFGKYDDVHVAAIVNETQEMDAIAATNKAVSEPVSYIPATTAVNDEHIVSGAASSASSVNGTSATTLSSTSSRPRFMRHSFSEELPLDADPAKLLHEQGTSAPSDSAPVSLPATGPLSASDPRTQLYVSNLPYRVRWQDLKDLFRRAGTVLRADVSLTPDNRSRGFGTVLLATEDDALRACDMFRGFNWQGRTLDVKIDRSGTLVGQGGPGLGQGNTLAPAAQAYGFAAPTAPHSPATALLATASSPLPSPMSNHSLSTSSVALTKSGSQTGSSVHGRISPGPSTGSPTIMNAARQAGHQAKTLPPVAHVGVPFGTPTNAYSASSGISPALLPFLGSSTRASIASPTSFAQKNAAVASPWNQGAAQTSPLQQRSSSLSAGGAAGPTGYPISPAMATHAGSGAVSPFGAGFSSPFLQANAMSMNSHYPPRQTAFASAPTRMSLSPSMTNFHPGSPLHQQHQQQASPSPNMLLGNASLPQAPFAAATSQQGSSYYGRVLFVGNLPFHCQWQDLKDLFRAAGNIQRADVALTPDGKSRGFGTVLFATPEDAQNAVRIYHGYEYSGRTLKVHFDRFAQMTVPQSGALPASPSQYTGAFAAANTPTPVTGGSAASSSSNAMSAAHPIPSPLVQHFSQSQSQSQSQQHRQTFFPYQQQQIPPYNQRHGQFDLHQQHVLHPQQASNAFMQNSSASFLPMQNPFGSYDGGMTQNYTNQLQTQQAQPQNHKLQSLQQPTSSAFTQSSSPFASALGLPSLPSQPAISQESAADEATAASETENFVGDARPSDGGDLQENDDSNKKDHVQTTDLQDGKTEEGTQQTPKTGQAESTQEPIEKVTNEPAKSASIAAAEASRSVPLPVSASPSSTTTGGAHPGRIQLPPQGFGAPQMAPFSPMHTRMSVPVPMTPGMPGFTFHAVPETPPVPHHFLSPGLGGPFSPPLASPTFNGPATPGAPAARPFGGSMINPAPGAPIHFTNAPMSGMVTMPTTSFNPMFPPIGVSYQAPTPQPNTHFTRLPQTPHWTQPQPRRPPPPSSPTTATLQQGRRSSQKSTAAGASHPAAAATTAATGTAVQAQGDDQQQPQQQKQQSLGLQDIHASTGASTAEELARKIAQMSVEKTLRQQRRGHDTSASSSSARGATLGGDSKQEFQNGTAAPTPPQQSETSTEQVTAEEADKEEG